MKIRLLNDRFTFKELKNDEKKYMLTYSFSSIAHYYRRHLSPPVRKMCQILDVPLMAENFIIFVKRNVSSAHIRKYTHN